MSESKTSDGLISNEDFLKHVAESIKAGSMRISQKKNVLRLGKVRTQVDDAEFYNQLSDVFRKDMNLIPRNKKRMKLRERMRERHREHKTKRKSASS